MCGQYLKKLKHVDVDFYRKMKTGATLKDYKTLYNCSVYECASRVSKLNFCVLKIDFCNSAPA